MSLLQMMPFPQVALQCGCSVLRGKSVHQKSLWQRCRVCGTSWKLQSWATESLMIVAKSYHWYLDSHGALHVKVEQRLQQSKSDDIERLEKVLQQVGPFKNGPGPMCEFHAPSFILTWLAKYNSGIISMYPIYIYIHV